MIKMVVTDIDGTIYSPKIGVTEEIKDCFRKLKRNNIKLVIATGRTIKSTQGMAGKFGVEVPLICYQGAIVANYTGEIWNAKYYDEKTARQVINDLRAKNIHMNVYVNDQLYVENDDDYIKEYIKDKMITYKVVNSFDELKFDRLNKVLAIDNDKNVINSLVKELGEKYKENTFVVKSTDYFCEIADKGATKGNAVRFLAQKWGFDLSEVLAIGDQNNDIDMVKVSGVGVAMGNGTPEIKKEADYITETVENFGFIEAMNKFVFKGEGN
ncbi:HAD family phosphatase [bacterium]|nr:HAD family phosphatase [bacterium]